MKTLLISLVFVFFLSSCSNRSVSQINKYNFCEYYQYISYLLDYYCNLQLKNTNLNIDTTKIRDHLRSIEFELRKDPELDNYARIYLHYVR